MGPVAEINTWLTTTSKALGVIERQRRRASADILASLDAGEPEPTSVAPDDVDANADADSVAPASVEGEPEPDGEDEARAEIADFSYQQGFRDGQAGRFASKADREKASACIGTLAAAAGLIPPAEGGGDGRPERDTVVRWEDSFWRCALEDGGHMIVKHGEKTDPDAVAYSIFIPKDAQREIAELFGAVPVDREARIDIVATVRTVGGDRIGNILSTDAIGKIVDALSGVEGSGEGATVDGETVICPDCMSVGNARCEQNGCGLLMLAEVLESQSPSSLDGQDDGPDRDEAVDALRRAKADEVEDVEGIRQRAEMVERLESQSPPSPAGDDDGLDVDELRVVVDFPTANEVGVGDKLWYMGTFRVVEKVTTAGDPVIRVRLDFERPDADFEPCGALFLDPDDLCCRSVGRFRPSPAVGLTVEEAKAVLNDLVNAEGDEVHELTGKVMDRISAVVKGASDGD